MLLGTGGDWTENRTQVGGYSNNLLSKFLPSPQAAKEGRALALRAGSGAHKPLLRRYWDEAGRSRPSLSRTPGLTLRCWGKGRLYTSLRQSRLGSLESAGAAGEDGGIQDPEGRGGKWHFGPLSIQPKEPASHSHRSKVLRTEKETEQVLPSAWLLFRAGRGPRPRLVAVEENGLRALKGSQSSVPRPVTEPAIPRRLCAASPSIGCRPWGSAGQSSRLREWPA